MFEQGSSKMKSEPYELWLNYLNEKSPALKEQLILHYITLVQKISKKISYCLPSHIAKEDLFSYGIFGLLEAIDRYDPKMGTPFSFFAGKRIRGAIIDGLRKEDWIPANIRRQARLLEEAYQKLEIRFARNASDEEVAAELSITLEELERWLKNTYIFSILSLDEPVAEGQEITLKDNVADNGSFNPVEIAENKEIKKILAKAVEELPEKERLVISLFYYHDLNNKEIARVLELSDARVSQIHAKAIFRLRGKLSRMKKALLG